MFDAPRKGPSTGRSKPGRKNGCELLFVQRAPGPSLTTDLMDTTMCRIDEQDFPIEPRQLTREKWAEFQAARHRTRAAGPTASVVGWSTRNRPACPGPSMSPLAAAWPRAAPGETGSRRSS